MLAKLIDPQGPRLWRTLAYLAPLLSFVACAYAPGVAKPFLFAAGIAAWTAIGFFGLRQRKPRNVELAFGAGLVEVKRAGTRNQTIRTKHIHGATTARTDDGVSVTLHHGRRDEPITLELATDADVHKLRHALGIGHGGFGTIPWRTVRSSGRRAAFGAAALAVVLTLAGLGGHGVFVAIVAALIALIGWPMKPEPGVIMTAEGLRLRTPAGWFALPYQAVIDVEDTRQGIVFTVPPPYGQVTVPHRGILLGALSRAARALVVAQIKSAVLRARGLGPQKDDISGRVDVLRRNEPLREWLVRLDMAGQLLSAGPGYRGNSLDTEDLWTILEDPEAEPDLRAAAARILRHGPPESRVRIDEAVAAVRDDWTSKRLRIALDDDVDGASEELMLQDYESQARMRAMGR